MSQHRSLKIDNVGAKHRNVLKRLERLKRLRKENRWDDQKSSMFGMPKVKSQKIKVKGGGEKEAKPAAEGAAQATEAKAPQAGAKPAAKAPAAKSAPGKEAKK